MQNGDENESSIPKPKPTTFPEQRTSAQTRGNDVKPSRRSNVCKLEVSVPRWGSYSRCFSVLFVCLFFTTTVTVDSSVI